MIGLDRFHCTDSYYTYTGTVWNLSSAVFRDSFKGGGGGGKVKVSRKRGGQA